MLELEAVAGLLDALVVGVFGTFAVVDELLMPGKPLGPVADDVEPVKVIDDELLNGGIFVPGTVPDDKGVCVVGKVLLVTGRPEEGLYSVGVRLVPGPVECPVPEVPGTVEFKLEVFDELLVVTEDVAVEPVAPEGFPVPEGPDDVRLPLDGYGGGVLERVSGVEGAVPVGIDGVFGEVVEMIVLPVPVREWWLLKAVDEWVTPEEPPVGPGELPGDPYPGLDEWGYGIDCEDKEDAPPLDLLEEYGEVLLAGVDEA
ncbi:MAG: hypothetical protein Q9165_001348 [Trypethelium subeluteriae]